MPALLELIESGESRNDAFKKYANWKKNSENALQKLVFPSPFVLIFKSNAKALSLALVANARENFNVPNNKTELDEKGKL